MQGREFEPQWGLIILCNIITFLCLIIFIYATYLMKLSLLHVLFKYFLCVFIVISYFFSFILILQFHFIARQTLFLFSLDVPVN